MNNIDYFLKYFKNKYNKMIDETHSINGRKNINRHTRLIMSSYAENGIALLIDSILSVKGKKYKYIVDAQITIDKKTIRPDIVIYDDSKGINEVVGIVEIKSQLGYEGKFTKEEYFDKRVNSLKKRTFKIKNPDVSDELYLLKNEKKVLRLDKEHNADKIKVLDEKIKKLKEDLETEYRSTDNLKDFVVILMDTNDHGNLSNFEGTNYFVLFHDDVENVWYYNLDKKYITSNGNIYNKQGINAHTYEDLVEYLEKNF